MITFIICIIALCIFVVFFGNFFKFIIFFRKDKKYYELIGETAVAETDITKSFGVAAVLNQNKKVLCKSYKNLINKGERVLITDYDKDEDLYIIDDYPDLNVL